MRKINNKKAQVWVETVIYTLIGLVLIGTVLAFATPVIEKQKDKSLIEKTINGMNLLDNTIINIKNLGVSNAREVNFQIGEGSMTIDSVDDTITFVLEKSAYQYSENRRTIAISGTNIEALSEEKGNDYEVKLTLNYDEKFDIVYLNQSDKVITFSQSPNPYRFIVENKGKQQTTTQCDEGNLCSENLIFEEDERNNYECSKKLGEGVCRSKYITINIYEIS